jgi:TPR repeat protein
MKRLLLLAAGLSLLAGHAAAQQGSAGIEDLRPKGMQFDGLGMEELPIGLTPEADSGTGVGIVVEPWDEALSISDDIFGPRIRVDEAYGAYQRGYFLTALALALPRAEKGEAAAQTLIAEIYAEGLGVSQNVATASGWYALASKNGDKLASFKLAMMYQDGRGVPKSRQRAAELFQLAVDQGSLAAKYNLALLHIEGLYAEPNMMKAAALMKDAAEGGIAEAQYDYGTMLIEGAGIAPNPLQGAGWVHQAAEQGLTAAQVDYATILYLGRVVQQDRKGAVTWYERAARAGNAVAQNRYAKLLAVGEGVELDLEEAAMWRALARRQGLTDPQLDKLLVSIPADELARAEEAARYWPDRPPTSVATADVPKPPEETQTQ